MSWMQMLVELPITARLGWTLVHSLWEGAALAIVLAAAAPLLRVRGARVEYGAAAATLMLLTALPMATFVWLGWTGGSPARVQSTAAVADSPRSDAMVRDSAERLPRRERFVGAAMSLSDRGENDSAVLGWVVVGWSAGVAALSVWNFGGWIRVQRLRRAGVGPVDEEIWQLAATAAKRMGISRAFRLLRSARVDSPIVIGFLKPLILLPASLLTELPVDQLESLLAHELAHIRRHDYLVNLIQAAIETLMFYHPAVWWVSGRMRVLREQCCDDLVVSVTGRREAYVRALARVARISTAHLAPAANGGLLIARLRRLMGVRIERQRSSSGWAFGAAVVALAIVVVIMAGKHPQARGEATTNPAEMAVVRGHVVDPDGKPVVGADVSVNGFRWSKAVVAQTKSGANGAFEISYPKSDFGGGMQYSWEDAAIVAAASGFGPVTTSWKVAQKGDVEMKLAPDTVPIRGKIVDTDGKPVAGAHVTVDSVQSRIVDLNKMDAAGNIAGESNFDIYIVPGFAPGVARDVVSGADGTFEIRGMGSDRMVDLVIQGPGIAWGQARVLTHPGPKVTKRIYQILPRTMITYGSDFEYVAEPGISVKGVVTDAATGEPLAGVGVESENLAMDTYFGVEGALSTTTDASGHYRLDGFPSDRTGRLENLIVALPGPDQPYLMKGAKVPVVKAPGEVTVDVRLHRGVWISGKVTDKATGKPVFAQMVYNPYRWNRYAAPIYDNDYMVWPRQGFYTSKADGSYRLVGLPGPAMVGAQCFQESYRRGVGAETMPKPKPPYTRTNGTFLGFGPGLMNAVKAVDIGSGAENTIVDLELDPGSTVKIKTVGPDDRAMSGVQVYGENREPTIKGSEYESIAYGPEDQRTLVFCDDGKKLGRAVVVGSAEIKAGRMTVKLEPLATVRGRFIDARGKPVGNIRVDPMTEPDGVSYFRTTTSDAQGRFEFTVPAGSKYWITFEGEEIGGTNLKPFEVTSGGVTDLGEVRELSE